MLNSTFSIPARQRTIAPGEFLFSEGQTGGVWRVVSGVLRLDQAEGSDSVLVMLAQTGDLVGFEALFVFAPIEY
jgi:CRP-like cAMP-binding protein